MYCTRKAIPRCIRAVLAILCLAALALSVHVVPAFAAHDTAGIATANQTVIHVNAATGDDAHDGTEAHPYKTLQAAITNAPDGACLTIHGEQKVSSKITISKSLTLVAGDAQAKLVREGNNGALEFNAADKTLTVGDAQAANASAAQASSAPVLTIEKLSLKVTAGRFEMYDGVNFVGSDDAAVLFQGKQAKGAVYGGSVTTDATLAYPANAFSLTDGAHIDAVRGGGIQCRCFSDKCCW